MDTNWTYYALVLTDKSRNKLMSYIQNSDYNYLFEKVSKVYLHHCTLLHKSQNNKDVEEFCNWCVNAKFYGRVTHIGYSNKAFAFKVEIPGIPCANKTPHITIGTYEDGKPVDSNYITNWKEINVISVETILKRI